MFNNRILHYTGTSTVANQVYGQPDFTTTTANNEGVSSNGLDLPQGLAVDGTGLYVADSANNRVLHYPVDSTVADFVYGQGWPGNSTINFTTNQSGGGTMGLNNPRDVAVDNTGIYVADSGNNRVVHYSRGNPVADFVYGQNNLNATQPNQGRLEPTATTLNNPTGITLDHYSGLYVADRNNNRIVYYSPFNGASKNGAAAVRVYGQSSFTAQDTSTTASTFNGPGAVAVDNIGDVFVLDIFNQRVLNFVAGWSIATQPSGNISTNTPFGLSAVLEDIGSGIIFADYTGPATVWIKPGTGPAGAVLGGKTTINTTKGTANFSGLRLDLKGTGYTLSVGCADYALTDTTSFAVN
jgi:sugar lactone lactonase YvrE